MNSQKAIWNIVGKSMQIPDDEGQVGRKGNRSFLYTAYLLLSMGFLCILNARVLTEGCNIFGTVAMMSLFWDFQTKEWKSALWEIRQVFIHGRLNSLWIQRTACWRLYLDHSVRLLELRSISHTIWTSLSTKIELKSAVVFWTRSNHFALSVIRMWNASSGKRATF